MTDTHDELVEARYEMLVDTICLALPQPHRGTCHRVADAILASGVFDNLRADAWSEGMRTGTSRAMRHMSDEPNLPLASEADNPYPKLGSDD